MVPHPTYSRYLIGQDGTIIGPRKVLKPFLNNHGYPCINIWTGGKWKQIRVHIMVCEAYHGMRPTQLHGVAHSDGNKRNNAANNLRWATQEENESDKRKHGRSLTGERHHQAKLNEDLVKAIKDSDEPGIILAKKYGVSPSTISCVRRRKSWAHLK